MKASEEVGNDQTETIKDLLSLFDEKRKNAEYGPTVFYFLKEILSHYGIPDSQHLCMLVNWIELFPIPFEWDKEYCNRFVKFNPEDETDISFTGGCGGWDSSVLALGANPTSFTLSLKRVTCLAIGIAPKEGFNHSGPTMYSCGCYLYNSNLLNSGGMDGSIKAQKTFLKEPYVYKSGSILTCFYNREKGELSFTYNGIDLGVGYTNIPLTSDYYAAVSVHGYAQIKLLDMTFNTRLKA